MAQLPFCFPPIETYQGYSFVLGVLLAYPEYSEIQYRSYINLMCQKTDHLFSIDLTFTDALWDDYYKQGLIEKNVYDAANFGVIMIPIYMGMRGNVFWLRPTKVHI